MKIIPPVNRHACGLAGTVIASIIAIATATPLAVADETGKDGFLEKVERWQDKMSEKFRDTWRDLRKDGGKASSISASVDLREQHDSYTVRLNLPDRDLDKVEIKLDGETLHIVAPASGKAGRYQQTVMLPGVAAGAKPGIERRKDDDLIVVTLPKSSAGSDPAPSTERPDSPLSQLSDGESDVLKSMEEMRREMDRIFDESFSEFRLSPEHKGRFDLPSFGSFVDLKEEGPDYIVTAYLPERDIKNVSAVVEDQTLKIEAKAEAARGKDGEKPSVTRKAHYSQLLALPGPVQADKIKVERKEGVLTVTLPKAQ
jgi:HSP20 family molecular chaperone IbpA